MKRLFLSLLTVMTLAAACQQPVDPSDDGESVVVLPDGAVHLQDTRLGIYFGNINHDDMAVFSVVLSNARCYQDQLRKPYLDSEGDMLVLNFRTDLLPADAEVALPAGDYPVSYETGINMIDASESYVTRLVGDSQSKWALKSGNVSVSRGQDGDYQIVTSDLVITKGEMADTVEYVFNSPLVMLDYLTEAPAMVGADDDIIDVPFTDLECIYNGDLFGYGTGNFIINMHTKGFLVDGEVMEVPGIYLTLNFFSRLYSGNTEPVLEEGRYTVSTATSSTLFQRWSLLPGLLMDTTPFGTYLLQIAGDGENVMEYITSGVVDIAYDDDAETVMSKAKMMIMNYTFKTSSRTISGEWRGEVLVDNQGATGSTDSYLTTLDHDVQCDMSKVTGGTLRLIETLHRDNVEPQWDYDIAEAWQLYLQPRDWTQEEKDIPWLQDDNENGIPDRLEAWCMDGDVMVLEFVLPLASQGVIAPELNKTYTYTMQPNLEKTDEMYEIYVSRMDRPADEIFDPYYAEQFPGWAEGLGITSYDRCNARRGFTWSEDGFRGNWYMHYETGRHGILDGHAPAVNGWVKVTRTGDDIYDFEWDFIDDNPGTPNRITGSIKDCKVNIHLN